jgi:hypothetical protein
MIFPDLFSNRKIGGPGYTARVHGGLAVWTERVAARHRRAEHRALQGIEAHRRWPGRMRVMR